VPQGVRVQVAPSPLTTCKNTAEIAPWLATNPEIGQHPFFYCLISKIVVGFVAPAKVTNTHFVQLRKMKTVLEIQSYHLANFPM
jgi:hypothetical protein